MTPAETFSRELRAAMTRRQVSINALAASIGIGRSSILEWRKGCRLPYHRSAVRVSEALDWPNLEALSIELHTKTCNECGRSFLDDSPRQYAKVCSKGCRNLAKNPKGRDDRYSQAATFRKRTEALLSALAAHCASCEPAGVCRDIECAFRPYTPLVKGGPELDVTPPLFGVAHRVYPMGIIRERKLAAKRADMRRRRASSPV